MFTMEYNIWTVVNNHTAQVFQISCVYNTVFKFKWNIWIMDNNKTILGYKLSFKNRMACNANHEKGSFSCIGNYSAFL